MKRFLNRAYEVVCGIFLVALGVLVTWRVLVTVMGLFALGWGIVLLRPSLLEQPVFRAGDSESDVSAGVSINVNEFMRP